MKITVPAEIANWGVSLIPATDPAAQPWLQQILVPGDREALAPLMPYAAVLVNSGQRRLLATQVGIHWRENNPPYYSTKGLVFAISDFDESHPSQVGPGQARMFVPDREINMQLVQPRTPRMPLDGQVHVGSAPTTPMETPAKALQIVDDMQGIRELSATVFAVVVEGVGLVGPDRFQMKSKGWDRTTTRQGTR